MKLSINKDAINKLKYQLKLKFRSAYQLLKAYYQKLNKRQRIALSVVGGLILLLLLVVSLSLGSGTVKLDYQVFRLLIMHSSVVELPYRRRSCV